MRLQGNLQRSGDAAVEVVDGGDEVDVASDAQSLLSLAEEIATERATLLVANT